MLADKEDIVEKMDLHEELPAPTFAQRPSRAASWSWEYCAEVELLENRTIIPTLNSHNFEGIPTVKTHEVMQPGPLQIRLRLLKRCNFENHFPELQKDKLKRHDWEGINHLAGLDREGSIKN